MKTIVSSGYTVLPTQHVAKAIINSILESPDDPKQRNEDSVGIRTMALLRRNKKQTVVINIRKYKRISGKKKGFILTFRMFQHTSSAEI